MARKPRIEFDGALYHVIQRGNNREFVFEHDNEKSYLLRKLVDCKKLLDFRLYGYVIMGNHYHLLLQTLNNPLHKIMHHVNSGFAKYYNQCKERTGHVFEGRYKAILVQDERYILTLLRYVHQNPLRGKICKNVWEYPWSSDVYYRQDQPGFIDIDLILDIFSDNRETAIAGYKEFVQEAETNDYSSVNVVGDESFIADYGTEGDKFTGESTGTGLDEILLATGVTSREFKLIKNGSRRRDLTAYKKVYARKAREQNYTIRQIAQNICMSESHVSRMLK